MHDDQWRETIGRIQDSFHVLDHQIVHGDEVSGDLEFIEFESPQGKMRLERASRPRVIGKTAIGSKRIGSSVNVKYEYSASERIHTVTAYRWNEATGEWVTMAAPGGAAHA